MSYPHLISNERMLINTYRGSKKLVIFFSATGTSDYNFHFLRTANELTEHTLLINNGRNEWYNHGINGLGKSAQECANNILKLASNLGAKEIYTIGQSMGGYGAVLYGHLLNAKSLAFGIESELCLPFSRSKKLLVKDCDIIFDMNQIISNSRNKIYLFSGESDPIDIYCLSKLKPNKNVEIHTLRGVSHAPAGYLKSRKMLNPLIFNFINNKPLPAIKAEGNALKRKDFPETFFKQFQSFKKKQFLESIEFGKKSATLSPDNYYVRHLLSKSYKQVKLSKEAHFNLCFNKILKLYFTFLPKLPF